MPDAPRHGTPLGSGEDAERALSALAELHGVETRYLDARGREVRPRPETLAATLKALGVPIGAVSEAPEALRDGRTRVEERLVEPVAVVHAGDAGCIPRGLGLGLDESVVVHLIQEDGTRREGTATVGTEGVPLLWELPEGYHRAEVLASGGAASSLVVAAPARAYRASIESDTAGTSLREWCAFLPLHAVRTKRDRGVGDLTDLEQLLEWVEGMGGSAVGLLPILAAFLDRPFDPSPYSPVSRLFWNELYLDPARLPEWELAPLARELAGSPSFLQRVRELRDGRLVDYAEAHRLQASLLQPLARAWRDAGGDRSEELGRFLNERPEAPDYATFRAKMEASDEPWIRWPAEWRQDGIPRDAFEEDAYLRHLYAQLRFPQQLAAVTSGGALEKGGLYLDLPLGTHPAGYDGWANPGLFSTDAAMGAPPDPYHDEGQSWGLAPVHPEAARADGHRHFRAVLGHLMPHARYLRIDHVMSLNRLYWVPEGMSARDGTYVRYPARELYAILCLESHRHRTIVVGEDLGTVPPETTRAMDERGVRRMYVVPFQLAPESPAGLAPVPAGAVASLNTHDLPTFAGAWRDEETRKQLRHAAGLDPERPAGGEESKEPRRGEHGGAERPGGEARRDELAGREKHQDGERGEDEAYRAMRSLLERLGHSPAGLVVVNLEDLWLEEQPQNVPGGGDPESWRRRSRLSLEELTADRRVVETLKALGRARVDPGEEP